MNEKQLYSFAPQHRIVIKDPETGNEKCSFNPRIIHSPLLSYSFSTNIQDTKGKFSLTFYPDEFLPVENAAESIYEKIQKLDIVEIYEILSSPILAENVPAFTGIVKVKKYASQCSDNNTSRRLVISGISVAGLVDQFIINLDSTACAVMKQAPNNDYLQKRFTINNLTSIDSLPTIDMVAKDMWNSFVEVATSYEAISTIKIKDYLDRFIGDNPFVFGDNPPKLKYPLGCVFHGQATNNFFSILDTIAPDPVYEKYVFRDKKSGKMQIMVRESPFDMGKGKSWDSLPCTEITKTDVKSFDITETDNDVYTVFFSYLDGYPIQEDYALKLQAAEAMQDGSLSYDKEKFGIYGYRPLNVHFNGYAKIAGEEDNSTQTVLQKLNERLCEWYSKLPDMLYGTITIVAKDENMPETGEKIRFMGGEFYVEGVEHKWQNGGNTEITLMVSRGGIYNNGNFEKFDEISQKYRMIETNVER